MIRRANSRPAPPLAPRPAQRGVTLVIALLMLVLITLFALTAIRTSSIGMRIVGNEQMQRQMQAAAQDAIAQVMSYPSSFSATAVAKTLTVDGYSVSVSAPTCLYSAPATGFSASLSSANITPEDDTFEVVATTVDPSSSAQAQIYQGVRMRALAGTCP